VYSIGDLSVESSPVKLCGAWQWPHHNVGASRSLAEQFATDRAKSPPNTVANDRTADTLRNDEPEPGGRRITRARKVDDGMRGRQSSTGANSGAEVRTTEHSVGLSEHGKTCELHHGVMLNRQARCALEKDELRGEFGAALATTSTQDGAAGASAHAKTEAVHLGATAVVRLESSLAHSK